MPSHRQTHLDAVAKEVKELHGKDEALSKVRVKSKVQQRDIRLRIGALVGDLGDAQLAVVAKRSGYTEARLKNFAFVRAQWPEGTYPDDVGFTPLEELARDEDRFTLIQAGMSKRDARAARGGRVDTPSRWSADVKASFIREALADPDIARQVAGDVSARAAVAAAENDLFREHRTQRDQDPAARASRESVNGDDAIRRVINARYMVSRSLDQLMNDGVTDGKRREFLNAVEDLATTVEWARSWAMNSNTSFEQDLDALLRSQEN